MADRTGKEFDNGNRLAEALFPLVREYLAARNVLERYGPENWAKLLHDLRVSQAFQDRTWHQIGAPIGTLPAQPSATDILTALERVIDGIVPFYPSEANPQ